MPQTIFASCKFSGGECVHEVCETLTKLEAWFAGGYAYPKNFGGPLNIITACFPCQSHAFVADRPHYF